MKRILVTILALLYMAGATGATVHVHYCMGKVMGANFGHGDDEMCVKCGMKKSVSKGCCKDEHKTVKTADHQLAKLSFSLTGSLVFLPTTPFYCSFREPLYTGTNSSLNRTHGPPILGQSIPVYLKIRNLRI